MDSFILKLEELGDSLIKEVTLTKTNLEAIFSKNFNLSDDNPRYETITNQDILSQLGSDGFATKKIERIFWSRFFLFDCDIPEIRKLKPRLSNSRVTNIILRSINFENIKNQNGHFALLDELILAPDYIGKWINLTSHEKMKHIARSIGESLLNGERSDIVRRSQHFAAYLLALHMFLNIPNEDVEQHIEKLKNHKLYPYLDPLSSNLQNVVNIVNFMFLASLLKAYREQEWKNLHHIQLHLQKTITSKAFGDPRTYPPNINWAKVQDIEPVGFFNWQKSFNEEDIVFFFKELNKVHEKRKEFWLQYKLSPTKVVLVLDDPTFKQLTSRFSSNEKALEIIKRSYRYNSRNTMEQLLIIFFFKEYVIVEGSANGFGCQIFKYEDFKKKFFLSFFIERQNNIIDQTSFEPFRGGRSGRELMLRHWPEDSWQNIFQRELAIRQIHKDKSISRVKAQEAVAQKGESLITDPIKFLRECGFEVIDMRLQGGGLWVIDTPSFEKVFISLARTDIEFVFSANGCKYTGDKPAWYLKYKT